MTDQEINVAIAESCGWRHFPEDSDPWNWTDPRGRLARKEALPDYCNDLNAMHEAEKMLDYASGQRGDYWASLTRIVAKSNNNLPISQCRGEYHATARQRAEAYLRTIGKWRE